jgi:3-oxoacyl-[acyl-carrier-protein] synthase-3
MAVPSRILTNRELEDMVDTSDEWIVQRTGIRERRIAGPDETASTLAVRASHEALERAGLQAKDLDMVIVGTVTGDMPFPSTSCLVQAGIGAVNAGAMDVGAACAGFIHALCVASSFIACGQSRAVLVVGVDVLTKFVDWSDRSTCVLFGDGAGAVVVTAEVGSDRGVIKTVMLADGTGAKHIEYPLGGSRCPAAQAANPTSKGLYMNGSEVYRFAVTAMGDACCRVLEEAGHTADDVGLFVPHQANLRIIRSAQKRIGIPDDRVFINVDRYGNTSGGSIPIGLYEAEASGRLKPGDLVLTVGFGAGLVWGANLIRW